MKLFKVVAWACGILAAIIIIVGSICLLSGKPFFGIRHMVNSFHVANSLLLMAILCVLARQGCLIKKD
jgi:hypothetical protein